MAEKKDTKSPNDEINPVAEEKAAQPDLAPPMTQPSGGGGWGGWGFSPLSYLSDLQKAATVAAEEISRNAVEVAKTAAKSLTDMENEAEDSEDDKEKPLVEEESEDENEKKRKAALDKLEKAGKDSFLGQGIKTLDDTVENFASGAWQALGNAWKGGSDLVHKLENSIQQGGVPAVSGSVAPSLIETGRAFTSKGMEVLELVGKETLDLLSIEVDKDTGGDIEDQLAEEVTFDRCFYIYGGSEQLEELEALSNHFTLLFNRRKAKLSPEQKLVFDGKFKEVQQLFDLASEIDGSGVGSGKGKKVEAGAECSMEEMKELYDSSVSKAAELAAGFENALAGLSPNDIIQRTAGRLDSLHSEGVHRLSEMCCFAVTHLLMLGKSIIATANKAQDQEADGEITKIDWPEDSFERAKMIRTKAQSMSGNLEAVVNSFSTGISDVAEACVAAIKGSTADSHDSSQKPIQEKASTFSQNLHADHKTAVSKIQDGLQFLTSVILSTAIPAA